MAADSALLVRCRTALGLVARPVPGVAGVRGGVGELAALLGAHWRTAQRWESGDTSIPPLVWVALWFLLRQTAGNARRRAACVALSTKLPLPPALRSWLLVNPDPV